MIIFVQIIGFISFLFALYAYHQRNKKDIFKYMLISNILNLVHYLLLNAYSGCVTKVIAIFRDLYLLIKKDNKKNNFVLYLLLIIYVIIGIFSYQKIYSLLPLLAASIYLSFVWNGNKLQIKKAAFYTYFLWLIYNICVYSIAGIVSNTISILSTLIALKNEEK